MAFLINDCRAPTHPSKHQHHSPISHLHIHDLMADSNVEHRCDLYSIASYIHSHLTAPAEISLARKLDVAKELSSYDVTKPSSEGTFASVYYTTWSHTISEKEKNYTKHDVVVKVNNRIALKLEDKMGRTLATKLFLRELAICARLEPHRNVLPLIGFDSTTKPPGLVMPRVDRPDFYFWLLEAQCDGNLSYRRRYELVHDIARGLEHLHGCHPQPIIHGNLHIGNIFLHDGVAVIADFGLSKLHGNSTIDSVLSDARNLVSLLLGQDSSLKNEKMSRSSWSDVYAFAQVAKTVISAADSLDLVIENGCGPMVDLLDSCMNPDPTARPTAARIAEDVSSMLESPPEGPAMLEGPPEEPLVVFVEGEPLFDDV
ncbi:kinase-like domain-containing protein [Mycena sp. CBHHK59/15]|nr:kinase-like domain-containing protein [Mycena sp. CBHHK59/15]